MADQAAGLRRLISRDFVRILAVTGARPGVGGTFVSRHLAAAVTSLGREVCLLDGAEAPFDHRHGDAATLTAALEARRRGAEFALLDVPATSGSGQARLAACAADVVVVLRAGEDDLRETYALMKRMVSGAGKCRLHVLINRSHDAAYANRIFGNLSKTSDKFLSQPIQFLGDLPAEDHAVGQDARDINLIDSHPHTPLARMLRALAERILLWPYPGENDMSGFARRLVAALRPRPSD